MEVYIYTFPNGKKYVGQTIYTMEHRAGFQGSYYKKSHQPLLYNAIQKYGWDSIVKETIECNNQEELDNLEKELIAKYHTTDKNYGYNVANGGASRSISEEGKQRIREKLTGRKLSDSTKQKIAKHSAFNKEVYCVELKQFFCSMREAGRQLNIKGTSHIGQVCDGIHLTCGGYHWKWGDEIRKGETNEE